MLQCMSVEMIQEMAKHRRLLEVYRHMVSRLLREDGWSEMVDHILCHRGSLLNGL